MDNLFEYIKLSDLYFQLWLIHSNIDGENSDSNFLIVSKAVYEPDDGWNPDAIKAFQDIDSNFIPPLAIEISGAKYNLHKGKLSTVGAKFSIVCSRMEVSLPFNGGESPVLLRYSNLSASHIDGHLFSRWPVPVVSCDFTAFWSEIPRDSTTMDLTYSRGGSPFEINLTCAYIRKDPDTNEYYGDYTGIETRWNYGEKAGGSISHARAIDVMNAEGIEYNLMSAGPSIFDTMDEFIFWAAINTGR